VGAKVVPVAANSADESAVISLGRGARLARTLISDPPRYRARASPITISFVIHRL
jgi:hypothetical protein